ncbi:MAG: hypothetical protein AAGH87_04660 [Pseudomonadota bacterium]
MEALRDPFSRVHPMFWPVLWLSLRAFAAWSGRMIAAGHGFAGLRVEVTWCGLIHVTALDLSSAGAALRRHIAGAPATTPWCLAGPGRARRQGPAFAPALSTAWIGAWPNAAPKRAKHAAVSQMPAPRPAPRRAPAGPTRPAKGRHTGLPPPLARALPIAA